MGCVECKPKDPCREVTICECPIKDLQTDCSVYVGEELKDINVKSGTILTTVLEKISNQFKRLKEYVDKSFEVRNVGDGISLYRGNHNVDGAKEIKTLIAGEGIELEESFNNKEVTIKATFEGGTEYIAGKDIKIEDNIISYDGIEYTAGDNITIETATNKISSKDTVYTAGEGISISNDNKISYTGEAPEEVVYTATSLGDKDIYKGKTQNNFEFRGIKVSEGSPIILTETETNIEIDIDTSGIESIKNYTDEMAYSVGIVDEENNYVKMVSVNPSTGLKIKDNTTHVVIEDIGTLTVDEIILNPGLPFDYIPINRYPIYRDMEQIRIALEREENPLILSNNARVRIDRGYVGEVLLGGDYIPQIREYVVPSESVLTVDITNPIENDIVFTGQGIVNISNMNIQGRALIKGLTITNDNPIQGEEGSYIAVEESEIKSTGNINTSGEVFINRTRFMSIEEDLKSNITTNGNSKVIISESTLNRPNILDINGATKIRVELKGNTVDPGVTGSIIEGKGSQVDIRSYGNIIENSNIMLDRTNLKSYGDITTKGIVQELREFPDKDSAFLSLGPGILYLRKEDKEKVVDYTYGPES